MGLRLRNVPPAQGLQWVREGFAGFARHPGGFTALFVLFMLAAVVVSTLPYLGGLLLMLGAPLLSLAYLMGGESAQRNLPPGPSLFFLPWQSLPPLRRRGLVQLCVAYAVATAASLAVGDWIDGGAFYDWLAALADSSQETPRTPPVVDAAVLWGGLTRLLLAGLVSVPFWHAPALIAFDGQSLSQALFSSALALWRSRVAYLMYSLGWVGALVTIITLGGLLTLLLGGGPLVTFLIMPLPLVVTVAFYVSLYPSYRDLFSNEAP